MSSNLHRDQSALAHLAGLREESGFPSRPANESDGPFPFPADWDRDLFPEGWKDALPAKRAEKLAAIRGWLAEAIAKLVSAATADAVSEAGREVGRAAGELADHLAEDEADAHISSGDEAE
jgi:hypothetical protein